MRSDQKARFVVDQRAQMGLSGKAMAVISAVISVIVITSILAATLGTTFTSVADVNAVFNDPNQTLNDTTTDSLLTVFPILIGLGFLFAVVGLVLAAVAFRRT